jgi:Fe-S-cluster containining protein
MSFLKKKNRWYVCGLHFECMQCGRCCAGPGEGYIWVTKTEIKLVADFMKMTVDEIRQKFLKRVGLRTTIIEHHTTRDCIFLNHGPILRNGAATKDELREKQKKCMIYPVRPNQCRVWPFWSSNLKSPDTWNKTAKKCPGVNRGRLYSYEEIEKIRKNKRKATEATENTEVKK